MACTSHDHDCDAAECGGTSLHRFIDHPHVCALPEVSALGVRDTSSAKLILRPWHERALRVHCLESMEDDPELLLHIPFTSDVKVRGIMVLGGDAGTAPSRMRAFTNRSDIDFELAAQLPPVQEWGLADERAGATEYATRYAKFQGVSSITLHFPACHGGDHTRLWFVGLRGEGSSTTREVATNVVYESRPQLKDHRLPSADGVPHVLQ